MSSNETTKHPLSLEELETLVAEADTGGRKPTGVTARILFVIALCWSLFQLWYASPLPYMLGIGIIGDNFAREIHLAFALRSEEHTSELQSLMRISYAVFCWKKKNTK